MLKIKWLLLVLLLVFHADVMNAQFLKNQMAQQRVKEAKEEKDLEMKKLFESKNLSYPPKTLLFRTFKKENIFEVWAKEQKTRIFVLVKSYEVCAMSGELGPKRKRGDYQVPEGFYYIDYYNAWSSFHLSVQINYPNQSDRILSPHKKNLGNAICIHGACASIGCIAIQDENIKEVYWLMVQAHGAGQANIPVHIFPSKLDNAAFNALKEEYKNDKDKIALWENLQTGYQYFEENKKLPTITVDKKGKYIFK